MKTTFNKQKAITSGAVIILLVSLIGAGISYNANQSTKKNLNDEKLKTELILSEKLNLEKEFADFKNQMNGLKGKNSDLDKVLSETSKKLSEKEEEISTISRENGSMRVLRKQITELSQMKRDFINQVLSLNESVQKLNGEKEMLNQTVASLQLANQQLAANLDILSSMTADNYLIESSRKNGKLTVMSRRTRKIAVSFKVPENMVESISFKIMKPDGSQIGGKNDQGLTFEVTNDDAGLLVNSSSEVIKVSKKIEMTYEPKEKLKAGVYKVEMFNGEKYVGACNVKLR